VNAPLPWRDLRSGRSALPGYHGDRVLHGLDDVRAYAKGDGTDRLAVWRRSPSDRPGRGVSRPRPIRPTMEPRDRDERPKGLGMPSATDPAGARPRRASCGALKRGASRSDGPILDHIEGDWDFPRGEDPRTGPVINDDGGPGALQASAARLRRRRTRLEWTVERPDSGQAAVSSDAPFYRPNQRRS
jgi:hypothetical protein